MKSDGGWAGEGGGGSVVVLLFGGNVFECLSGFCNTIQLKFDNR